MDVPSSISQPDISWTLEKLESHEDGQVTVQYFSFETFDLCVEGFRRLWHPWCMFRLSVDLGSGFSKAKHVWLPPVGYQYLDLAQHWREPFDSETSGLTWPHRDRLRDEAAVKFFKGAP
jgi:hypothetical protein